MGYRPYGDMYQIMDDMYKIPDELCAMAVEAGKGNRKKIGLLNLSF